VKEAVSLKCLTLQGVFEVEEPVVPVPRVTSLEGKTIGAFWDGKAGGDHFCIAVEELTNRELQRIDESINLKPGGKVSMANPDDIHIIVAGSVPGYSFGMRYFHTAHQTKQVKHYMPWSRWHAARVKIVAYISYEVEHEERRK
jgi:hypothetical protein